MDINNSTVYPTGESCPACGAEAHFVPGHLVTAKDGSKKFTVVRTTTHLKNNCPKV